MYPLLYSFVIHVGWLTFILVLASIVTFVVQEVAKDVMVAQVTKQQRLATIDLEHQATQNKLTKEQHEINNAALLEQMLISTGRHPKLSTFDVN